MRLFKNLKIFSFTTMKQQLFRRDVETAIMGNRAFRLPALPSNVSANEIFNKYRTENTIFNERLRNFIQNRSSETKDKPVYRANEILSGNYSMYDVSFKITGDIDWQFDYLNKYAFPKELYWKYTGMEFPLNTEFSVPLVLGRFYQVHDLAIAYSVTGDEVYTRKIFELVNSFKRENRLYEGVQWSSVSDAAIRLINFLSACKLILHSSSFTEEIKREYIQFVLAHSIFIENNLDLSANKGEKYLICLLALHYTGVLFSQIEYGKKLLAFSQSHIEQEVRKQFHTDGSSYLQSLPAHLIACEVLVHFMLSLQLNIFQYSAEFSSIVKRIGESLKQYVREDGSVPHLGDETLGAILPAGNKGNRLDVSHLMTSFALLFNNAEAAGKFFSPGLSHYLYFDAAQINKVREQKTETFQQTSFGFRDGGNYILRDYTDVNIFIKIAGIGRNGQGAPGHNDTFTFELFYKNTPFIVDSGTYSLFANPELRNTLRSVISHNTPYVDDTRLVEMVGIDGVKSDFTSPKVLAWKSTADEDILSVQHYAYVRLHDPVICKRTFHFSKEKKELHIQDEFLGGTDHKIVLNIHLHPNVFVEEESKGIFLLKNGDAVIRVRYITGIPEYDIIMQETLYSDSYYHLQKSFKLHFACRQELPVSYIIEVEFL